MSPNEQTRPKNPPQSGRADPYHDRLPFTSPGDVKGQGTPDRNQYRDRQGAALGAGRQRTSTHEPFERACQVVFSAGSQLISSRLPDAERPLPYGRRTEGGLPQPFFAAFLIGIAIGVPSATAQEFSFVPVGACEYDGGTCHDGGQPCQWSEECPGWGNWCEPCSPITLLVGPDTDDTGEPTEIFLPPGTSAYQVEFEVRVNGWGQAPGTPTLGFFIATLVTDSLLGANANPPNPGVDLISQAAFIATRTCHTIEFEDTGQPCDWWALEECPPEAPNCDPNPRLATPGCPFAICDPTPCCGFDFSYTYEVGPFTWWGLEPLLVCLTDNGQSAYAGTLILDIPQTAEGIYTLEFDTGPWMTYLGACFGPVIPDVTLTPGKISIGGACCMPGGACVPRTGIDCGVAGVDPVVGNCADDTDGDGVADPCDPCPNDTPDDSDGDGICTSVDNCPYEPNTAQDDNDDDGLGNACDNCLNNANPVQEDCNADGQGDACETAAEQDDDQDGVCNGVDNCPDHANPGQENCDGTGMGDACSIALGLSDDCPAGPGNGVPDECESDCDGDGQVDSCAIARCTGDPACSDCQRPGQPGSGVPDWCDLNVSLVSVDTDANGVPDECDFGPPLPAPYPSNRKKARYITFDANKTANDDRNVAYRVELKDLSLGSCEGNGAMCREERGGDDCGLCCPMGGSPCTTKPCLSTFIDCNRATQTCEPTGELCINDFTLDDDPIVGRQSVGRTWWVGPAVDARCSISGIACTPGGDPCGRCFDIAAGELTSRGCLSDSQCDPGWTCQVQSGEPCASIHRLVDQGERLVSADWPELVQVGDCEIVPVAQYGVVAVDLDGPNESAELTIETIDRPVGSGSYWADAVGRLDDYCTGTWTPCGHDYGPCVAGDCVRGDPGNPVPDTAFCDATRCIDPACPAGEACIRQWGPTDRAVNFDDITAALFAFYQPRGVALPFISWVDVNGAGTGPAGTYPPDFVPNTADVQFIRLAFEGRPYPFVDPGDCP